MNTSETYRPANIEFNIDGGLMPANFGFEFKTANDAIQFMAKHLIGVNSKVRASRFMDNFEKNEIRKEYMELLEQKIPMLERELAKAKAAFDEAKKEYADSQEYVSATTNEAKSLAVEVKRGVKEMELDDMFTWRVPVGERYYFYTFIDNQIKLCSVRDIPFHERQDLYNAMNNNEDFFKKCYPEGFVDLDQFVTKAEESLAETAEPEAEYVDEETGEIFEKEEPELNE